MSSVQLSPTLHLWIRPSTPSISHPSILSSAGSPAYYFLDTAVRTCAAEPQTPELATYDMARPPPFPCCDGYGLSLGVVGFCHPATRPSHARSTSPPTARRHSPQYERRPIAQDHPRSPFCLRATSGDLLSLTSARIPIASAPPSEIGTILSARTAGVDARSPHPLRRVPRRPIRRPRSRAPSAASLVVPLAHHFSSRTHRLS
ncbi:hypothetical protein B0H13DRAFT_2662882 [Mycena leptocephala]|nr:hypothetical protein B0H13DRAFT_2662882 [Mycena leptocephala]